MGVDGVSLKQILWSECFTSGTFESINFKDLFSITPSGLLAGLLLPHTTANEDVEDQGYGAGQLKSISIVTLDVLVASILVRMVEHAIGSLTLGISVWRWFLDIDPVSTIHVMWQHALLVVGNLVIKQQSLGTELDGSYVISTNVKQVALLKISEFSILFWTSKVWSFSAIVLTLNQNQNTGQYEDLCCSLHCENQTELKPFRSTFSIGWHDGSNHVTSMLQ